MQAHDFGFGVLAVLLAACSGELAPTVTGDDEVVSAQRGANASADPNDVWLAFGAAAAGPSEIHVIRADGSAHRKLDLGVRAADPAFSANGKALAYAGPGGIWVRDLTTGQSRQLTTGADGVPAWSPDGKLIAFTRDVDIRIIGADGSGERVYVKGPPPGQEWYSNYGHPVFSGDGALLIFDRRGAVEMGAVDGTGIHPVFTLGGQAMITIAGVSPDGSQVAFGADCTRPAGGLTLVVVPIADASNACTAGRALGQLGYIGTRPAWSTNGLIAFADQTKITVFPASGGAPTTIFDATKSLGGMYVSEPAWSPPGTVIR